MKKRKNICRDRKGFTTVELVVVIVLIMLLAGGLIFAGVRWVQNINFTRQNETARTLYTIAQNQLTEYSESGQLDEFQSRLKDNSGRYKNTVDVNNLKSPDGLPYSLSGEEEEGKVNLWPSSYGEDKYQDTICYLKGTPDDYEKYLDAKNGTGTVTEEIKALYDLFDQYLYDTSVLKKGVVCVELTPEDGLVFAVLYSDIAEDFTYKHTDVKRGMVSIDDRKVPYRKARMVGYYGIDSLYKATSTKLEKPSILNLKLNNEETLNLSFQIGKVPAAATKMKYEITVYGYDNKKNKGTALLRFSLDGTKLKPQENKGTVECNVKRWVYDAEGNGTEQDLGEYQILAWIEGTTANPQVRIVLDAADLGATTAVYKDAYPALVKKDAEFHSTIAVDTLKNTLSFRRFGLTETEDIYCKVIGQGGFYKKTSEKQSNTENASFASYKESSLGGKKTIYTLRNARHLYNMRYVEDYTKAELGKVRSGNRSAENTSVIYELAANIDWTKFVEKANLFENGGEKPENAAGVEVKKAYFPSIRQLGERSALHGPDRQNYVISGLKINAADNIRSYVYDEKDKNGNKITEEDYKHEADKSAGLFLANYGEIKNIVLDKIQVTGGTQVGAFCGVNSGTLTKLVVKNTDSESKIQGIADVGGILGTHLAQNAAGQKKEQEIALKELVNYAKVSERIGENGTRTVSGETEETKRNNFGGIAGRLISDSTYLVSVTVEKCKNYGQIEAADVRLKVEADGKTKTGYTENLGGIAGKTDASEGGEIIVKECSSSPQYTDRAVTEILQSKTKLEAKLKGCYVGGIIGYNKGAKITNCDTRKENSSKEGYVFGAENVGGIVGFNSKAKENDSTVIEGGNKKNQVHVIGQSYVGGIVGGNPEGTVQNWVNEGFVGATESYAGGIAGYNGDLPHNAKSDDAFIKNCTSEIANSSAVRRLTGKTELLKADYVGGITGYNNGAIKADKSIRLVSSVTGGNFVGGVIGYNDVDAEIVNYGVSGGYITADGTFVGGFCGLNASKAMLQAAGNESYHLVSNPNQVSGKYCVGGIIGANIIPTDDSISCSLLTDNFLGALNASGAFAGGYIGYNRLTKGSVTRTAIMDAAQQACETLKEVSPNTADGRAKLQDPEDLLFKNIESTNARLTMTGKESNVFSQSRLGGVSAPLYVGGVAGYNAEETAVTVIGVENKTPVTASEALDSKNAYPTYTGSIKKFSFAGGIIGKVTRKVVIENCCNKDTGAVLSAGTYTGGLCEINEGKIIGCTASNLGSSDKDYVGGIVGINNGTVENCVLEKGRTIIGRNYVGGIAAENYGTISDPSVRGNISAYGTYGYVGGVTAYNGGKLEFTDSQKFQEEISLSVSSAGNYVGGIVGVNDGSISKADETVLKVEGKVDGLSYVGGIVGSNNGGVMSGYENMAAVTASNGYAGGIAGEIKGKTSGDTTVGTITNCTNSGVITARQGGYAGGIVAMNEMTVSNCTNTGEISSPNGDCGGITAVNGSEEKKDAKIAGCTVESTSAFRKVLTFTGKNRAGGVCGVNYGTIESSKVSEIVLTDIAGSKEGMLGGITAENMKEASILQCSTEEIQLKSYSVGSCMGGVTGTNLGTIQGQEKEYTAAEADLAFVEKDLAYYGNMGGIAGVNSGTISWYRFSGTIAGTGNNPQNPPQYDPTTDGESSGAVIYGYGGIAGVNGSSADSTVGTIQDCSVYQAKITGIGDATNVVNIGGITGVNGIGGTIDGVTVGEGVATYKASLTGSEKTANVLKADTEYSVYIGTESSTSAYAHAGGIAGLNIGRISRAGYSFTEEKDENGETTVLNPKKTDLENTSVMIEGYRGHIGGVTGYNRRTGTIEKCATGSKWVVYEVNNAQDNGCGGIIGYQAGENGMDHCVNAATVIKTTSQSNGVGGMVGRMEVATAKNYLISNCVNYGDIYGYARVGGMIGVAKYYGGTISNCTNYGKIQAKENYAGGMFGMTYDITEENGVVSFSGCANHGTIAGNTYCGGIFGGGRGSKYTVISCTDCVNTGLIKMSGDSGSGICGAENSQIHKTSTFVRCRNYGYSLTGSKAIGGIISSQITSAVTLQQNFGIALLDYPIAMRSAGFSVDTSDNYYLSGNASMTEKPVYYDKDGNIRTEKPETFYVRTVSAPNITGETNLYKIVADEKGLEDGSRAYFSTNQSKSEWSYTFTFSREIELSGIHLWWFNSGSTREQNYTIYYSQYTEGDFSEFGEVDNISSNEGTNTIADQKQMVTKEDVVTARRVKVLITGSGNQETTNVNAKDVNACLMRIRFIGNVDGKAYQGYQYEWQSGNAYKPASGFEGMSYSLNGKTVTYTGYPYEMVTEVFSESDGKDKGHGQIVVAAKDEDSGGYRLQTETGGTKETVGEPGFKLDPYTKFSTKKDEAKSDASLKVTGASDDNIRYQVYDGMDKYLTAKRTIFSLNIPQNVKLENSSGGVKAFWGAVEQADYYQYEAVYYDATEDGNVISTRTDTVYGTSVELPISSVNGQEIKRVEFRVRAGADVIKEDGGEAEALWSGYSETVSRKIDASLPIPSFHLELVIHENTLKYKAFLDNYEDYKAFLENRGIEGAQLETELGKIQITIRVGSNANAMSFTVKERESSSYYAGNNGSISISAQATYKPDGGEKIDSAKALRESSAPQHEKYVSTDAVANVDLGGSNDGQVGFHGKTSETLSYLAKLKYKDKTVIAYMRSEFVAKDQILEVPVSVASSEIRLSDTTEAKIETELTPLPADLLNKDRYRDLMVRSYPSVMTNNVVYNGHEVLFPDGEKTKSADELKETIYYVTADNMLTTKDTGTKLINVTTLAPGFVLRLDANGEYSVYYNTLLAYNDLQKNVYDKSADATKMLTQVFYYYIKTDNLKKQNPPIIHYNDAEGNGTDGDPNQDIMTITWDLEAYKNEDGSYNYTRGAVYNYTVTGYTPDGVDENGNTVPGTAVQITTGEYTTGESGENELVLDTTSWSYREVVISISRQGEMNQQGVTTVFPSGTEIRVPLKMSFSQIESPNVVLHSENGTVQKNSLMYDVTWRNIPTTEHEDLAAYEVKAKRNPDDTVCVYTYTEEEKYKTALESMKALYNEKSGKQPTEEEIEEGKTSFTWIWEQTGSQNEKIRKEMVITTDTSTKGTWKITKNLEITWTYPVSDADKAAVSLTKTIDLQDFERGEAIRISVRAIAVENPETYRNGPDGVPAEMTLPSRLDVPSTGAMMSDPAYDKDNFVTIEFIEKTGITLNYKASDIADANGNYQIAAAVYETEPTEVQKNDTSAKASGDDGENSWNAGAYATLSKKAEPIQMEGNLEDATVVLDGLKRDYGGKWLKIVMRSISDNNISSVWSDEDAQAAGTTNYAWVRIPRVQEETPSVQTEKEALSYDYNSETGRYAYASDPTSAAISLEQTKLSYEMTQLADHYMLTLVRSQKDYPDNTSVYTQYTVRYTDWIFLEAKENGEYAVFYASSDPGFDPDQYREYREELHKANPSMKADPVSEISEDTVYLGSISENQRLHLPYRGEVPENETRDAPMIDTVSWIGILSAGNERKVEILLPDTETVAGSAVRSEYGELTDQVSVQGIIAESRTDYYHDSMVAQWFRQDGQIKQSELEEYSKMERSLTYELTGSASVETPLTLKVTGAMEWLVLDIRVKDASGNELCQRYVSCYGDGTSNINNVAFLPANLWGYAENAASLEIRAAEIIRSGKGISRWSEGKAELENIRNLLPKDETEVVPEEPTPEPEPIPENGTEDETAENSEPVIPEETDPVEPVDPAVEQNVDSDIDESA